MMIDYLCAGLVNTAESPFSQSEESRDIITKLYKIAKTAMDMKLGARNLTDLIHSGFGLETRHANGLRTYCDYEHYFGLVSMDLGICDTATVFTTGLSARWI
ncbi:hypothetical protein CHUAL_013580 [Chamberlinius hualienensis]